VVIDRVLKQVNQRICEMLGYAQEELIDRNARILYPSDEEYENVGREKYGQIRDRGTGTVETHFKCKDGRIIDVLINSTPMDLQDLSKGVTFTGEYYPFLTNCQQQDEVWVVVHKHASA
jgi:PAS domain S-box-containing protein